MGYTGATFKEFFGSGSGLLYTLGIMLAWIALPLMLALRTFNRKDL
jgi:Cu-processing system permease protein